MECHIHKNYMEKVIELAQSVSGKVSPNPYVAAIIVAKDRIVSQGIHSKAGTPHAEAIALSNLPLCYERSRLTLYVNLEPCCHLNKRTPPCAQLIVKSGIKRVVIGSLDYNHYVNGKGVKFLEENGVSVTQGILQDECIKLNKVFFKNMKCLLPYFHGKIAASLDGIISLPNGSSKWISSKESRSYVHVLRESYDAILVGKRTFLIDRPRLNARSDGIILKENKKVILGSCHGLLNLIPEHSKKFYYIISKSDSITTESVVESIDNVLVIFYRNDIVHAFKELYKLGICSILVEGGAGVFTSLIESHLLDEMSVFKAPIFLGRGKSITNDLSINEICNSVRLKNVNYSQFGNDLYVNGVF